jgi:hypothetical protein
MIDKKTFNHSMDLLQKNYKHIHPEPLPEEILDMWHEYLSDRLTDQEFIAAVKYFILHVRYWPVAADLVDHIHGGKETKGLQEWASILDAAGRDDAQERLVYLSDRASIALKAIGGVRAVSLADGFERPRLEKKFISIYCQCSSEDRKALAQSAQTSAEVPRYSIHDEEEQERNRQERMRRWEEQNGKK